MFHAVVEKNSLVQLLGGASRSLFESYLLLDGIPNEPPAPKTVAVFWLSRPNDIERLPRLIVVPNGSLEEFLAWSTTFIPGLKPLTAFVRVISWDEFKTTSSSERKRSKSIESIIIGATYGELLTGYVGRSFLETISTARAESTLSAAMSQGILRGWRAGMLDIIKRNWHMTRQLTGNQKQVSENNLDDAWYIIERLTQEDDSSKSVRTELVSIEEACKQIRHGRPITTETWQLISGGLIPSDIQVETLSQPKEKRVEAFEIHTAKLLSAERDTLTTTFMIGYLASLVSGGSLEHIHLLTPFQEQFQGVIIWYGICSGLMPGSKILSDYSHLGLSLVRRMTQQEELFSVPSCDVALDEMKVLLRGEPTSQFFRQVTPSYLRVEIAPTVHTIIRWPLRPMTDSQPKGQLDLFGNSSTEPPTKISDVGQLVQLLQDGLRLAQKISFETPRGQREKTNQKGRRRRNDQH